MWEGSGIEGVVMQCGRDLGLRVWSCSVGGVWPGWRVWPCSVGAVRDRGCGHAVWEGSGMARRDLVWSCNVGGVRDGGCGHAMWEGSEMEKIACVGGVRDGRCGLFARKMGSLNRFCS